jgi:hypothetical protein
MGEEKIELDERTLVFIHEKLREARYEIKSLTDAIIAEGLKSHSNHQEGDRLYQLVLAEVKRVEGDDYSRNGRVKFEGVEHEPRKRLDSHEEALVDALLGDGWRVTEIRDRFEREGRTAGFNWRSVYDAIRARSLRAAPEAATTASETPFSSPYRPAEQREPSDDREPFEVDPNEIDRSTNEHHKTQQLLADLASSNDRTPVSPDRSRDPDFDAAWNDGDHVVIVEVKSINDSNESRQVRLGVGQILDYQHDAEQAASIPDMSGVGLRGLTGVGRVADPW